MNTQKQPIPNTAPPKKVEKPKYLTYEEALKYVPNTEQVAGMTQKGIDLKNVLWPRRRALEELRASPAESIHLIGPTPQIPLTVVFLQKRGGRFFYGFIKAIEQEPEQVPA